MEPKLIEIPGIPGKLREQSLDEFLSVLTPDHLARKQLDEIRNQALKSVELSTQLMQANEKVIELQNKLMAMPATTYLPPAVAVATFAPEATTDSEVYPPIGSLPIDKDIIEMVKKNDWTNRPPPPEIDPRSGPFPKVECPHCKKQVSSAPGPWSIHQRNNHPDNQAPRPKV